jgi:metal-responsive CopG/Arc/MetJ family transcriptional regulator
MKNGGGNWVYPGYTQLMKTAISIPDKLFQAADEFAGRVGISRSELYSKAVDEYLAANRFQGVREQLNHVYANANSKLDPQDALLQSDSIEREDW